MIDIKDYQYNGISLLTYGLLTLTTAIIAVATLADSAGDVVEEMTENVIDTFQNPEQIMDVNPVQLQQPQQSFYNEEMQNIYGGKRRRKTYKKINKRQNGGHKKSVRFISKK